MFNNRNLCRPSFLMLLLFMELIGAAIICLCFIWLLEYRSGFSWRNNPSLEFNYHVLFMITGMIFLNANGILIYRVFDKEKKLIIKWFHALIMAGALGCSAVGLLAAFDSHNLVNPPIPNMYSMHSYMGMLTVFMYGFMWLFGFSFFLLPYMPNKFRDVYKPVHTYGGLVTLLFAAATCCSGLNEKAFFVLKKNYGKYVEEGLIINSLGVLLLVYVFLVGLICTNPNFARRNDFSKNENITENEKYTIHL